MKRVRTIYGDCLPDWGSLLDRPDVLIVNTQAGNFDLYAEEAVEVAAIDTTGALAFEALALPQGHITKEAIRHHGLTLAKLEAAGARPWPRLWAQLAPILAGASALLSWNDSFDRRVLYRTNRRHDLVLPFLPWRDLVADHRALRPGWGHGLQEAARQEGVAVTTAHRAHADCATVLAVMRAVAKELETRLVQPPRDNSPG